jgi:hypothetical protein
MAGGFEVISLWKSGKFGKMEDFSDPFLSDSYTPLPTITLESFVLGKGRDETVQAGTRSS